MSLTLRIILVASSLMTCIYAIQRIRSAKVDIGDTVYWILVSFYLLLISVFPDIVSFFSRLFGIQSPVNMVFLSIIALLGYKCFSLSIKVSLLEIKLKTLAIQIGLEKTDQGE